MTEQLNGVLYDDSILKSSANRNLQQTARQIEEKEEEEEEVEDEEQENIEGLLNSDSEQSSIDSMQKE